MQKNKAEEKPIDIRKICLYKKFRETGTVPYRESEWHVFGYYDSMDIMYIDHKGDFHLLETIYNDAEATVQCNQGDEKCHTIYSLGLDPDEEYEAFWKDTQKPLMFVTLVYFKHPVAMEKADSISWYTKK